MYVSIDGKIDGSYMEEDDRSDSGDFYDEAIWQMGNANGSGRVTAEMYFANHEIDYAPYAGREVPEGDYICRDAYYWVVFDRRGRCNWLENKVEYGGKEARVVMVLTEQVRKEYLAYLREKEIPYLLCGKEDLDLPLAMEKCKKELGIDTLVLSGGALINGAFFKAGLIDEISLVMAPYIEGNAKEKSFLDTLGSYVNTRYRFKDLRRFSDGGVQLLFEKENEG